MIDSWERLEHSDDFKDFMNEVQKKVDAERQSYDSCRSNDEFLKVQARVEAFKFVLGLLQHLKEREE